MDFIYLYIIGLAASVLGTMAGGGGLISLPAMLLLGIPVHSAIGANKVSNTVASLSSFLIVYKNKRVTLKEAAAVLPVSLAGGVAGGFLASRITAEYMYILAVVLLAFAFITSFIGAKGFAGDKPLKLNRKSIAGLFGIGLYDGVFGPGSGTLAMMLYAQLNVAYLRAVGLARIAIFSSCFGAAVTYIATGQIIWPLTIALLLGSLSGAQLGVQLANKLKPRHVKPLLRTVTVLLIVQTVYQNFIV